MMREVPDERAREVTGEVIALHPASAADGAWVLGTVQPASGGPPVTFVGVDLLPCLVGATVRLAGVWRPRPGGGWQLEVTDLDSQRPTEEGAVERYLVANVRGCGPARARRIVRVLGAGCLDRLEQDPAAVTPLFPGAVGHALAYAVGQWATESRRETRARALAVRLLATGVTYGVVRRIMSYFSTAEAAEVAALRRPYRLLEVPGVGWATADRIARALGARTRDPERLEAACRHALDRAVERGHSGLPADLLLAEAGRLAGVSAGDSALSAALAALDGDGLLADVAGVWMAPEVREAEWRLAERLATMVRSQRALDSAQRAAVAPVIAAAGLSAAQQAAVWMGLGHGASVLTGRPGSGKTTTLRTFIAACRALGLSVQVVAPTGKAASRAAAVTGVPAATVHRLLRRVPPGDPAADGAGTTGVQARVVVVDEASLCDLDTAVWLASALDPERTQVLWAGDADQLPSVGHGQVLADLIASGGLPVARLTEVFRQSANSRVVTNAHALLDGAPLQLDDAPDWRTVEFGLSDAPADGAARLLDAVRSLVAEGVDPAVDLQVLAPTRGGPLGVDALNAGLQAVLNPAGDPGPMVGGGARARIGDRVVMTRNLYDLSTPLFNGETGVVVAHDASAQRVTLRLDDGREATLRGVQALMLRLAWALTVHRAQGSEYPHVILAYDHRAHAPLLDPGVLYTAVTRAKVRFTLVGTREAVRYTQAAVSRRLRHTGLARQIREALALDVGPSGEAPFAA